MHPDETTGPVQQQTVASIHRLVGGLQSIVFICGCGHSGTSILANILASHPDIHAPLRETAVFLGSEAEALKKTGKLLREAIDSGRPVLIEKTPRHIHQLDRIRTVIPGAMFIFPVRDGRDVVASIKRRTGASAIGGRRWIEENRIVASQKGKPDSLIYRYEDFVERPEDIIERVCDFIGIPFHREVMEYYKTPRLWFGQKALRPDAKPEGEKDQKARRNWQINQPLFDGRGRWKSEITEAEFPSLLSGEGRQLMALFGYEI